MLECKDLPHCKLSRYLEERVVGGLRLERQARAAKVRGCRGLGGTRAPLVVGGARLRCGLPLARQARAAKVRGHGSRGVCRHRDARAIALAPAARPLARAGVGVRAGCALHTRGLRLPVVFCRVVPQLGTELSQTPTSEGLSIRVVNNVIKKCEVKPKFLEAFGQDNSYPTALPYRQRVVLLFQTLDGVDVCLFCM